MTKKEKREFHISFCRVCKNRKMNFERGIICSLTGKVADFNESGCENYLEDKTEKESCKIKFKEILKDAYPETNIVNNVLSRKSYKSYKKIKIKEIIIPNEKKLIETNKLIFIATFIFTCAVFVYNIYLNFEEVKPLTFGVITVLSIGVIVILTMGYFAFIKKLKNNEILIDEMKIKFTKYSLFDECTNLSIYWNEIAEFGVITTPHKNGDIEEILVKSFTGKETLLYPKTYKLSTDTLLEILKNRSKL